METKKKESLGRKGQERHRKTRNTKPKNKTKKHDSYLPQKSTKDK